MTANGVDLAPSVPCLRTLGTGANQALPGNTAIAVADGDKGDVTVSGSGATWTVDAPISSAARVAAYMNCIGSI